MGIISSVQEVWTREGPRRVVFTKYPVAHANSRVKLGLSQKLCNLQTALAWFLPMALDNTELSGFHRRLFF